MKALESETGGEEAAARTSADNFYLCLKENEPQALCRRLGKLAEAINGFNRQAAKPDVYKRQPMLPMCPFSSPTTLIFD